MITLQAYMITLQAGAYIITLQADKGGEMRILRFFVLKFYNFCHLFA